MPSAEYLQSDLQIEAIQAWIRSTANSALAEIGVPLTVAFQTSGDGGTTARSGVSIAAMDADLIAYTKARQPLFDIHEEALASLLLAIGASPPALQGTLALALADAAQDPQLRVLWGRVRVRYAGDKPGTAGACRLSRGLSETQVPCGAGSMGPAESRAHGGACKMVGRGGGWPPKVLVRRWPLIRPCPRRCRSRVRTSGRGWCRGCLRLRWSRPRRWVSLLLVR